MSQKLQEIFAANFARDEIEGAKRWARKWYAEMNQELPGGLSISMRAMAGHISDYLEGFDGTEPESYGGSLCLMYSRTKYGGTMYSAMFGDF